MSEKKNKFGLVGGFIVSFAMFTQSYAQYQLSPLASQLMAEFGLSTTQFSSLFTATLIPAIFLSIVSGMLADKLGLKPVIAVSLILSTAGAFLRIGMFGYAMLFTSMLLIGICSAFLNANAAKIFGSWFPPSLIGVMMGVYLAASTLGQTVGMATTALLPGIGFVYILTAVMFIVPTLMWILMIRFPKSQKTDQSDAPSLPITECLKVVVKSKGVWLAGLCLLGTLGSFIILGSFLPTALAGRGIDTAAAGFFGAAVTFGCMFGCLLGPSIAAKLGKDKPVIMIFALIAALGCVFGWQAPQGILLAVSIFITGFAQGGIIPIAMSIPIRLPEIGPVYAGTAGGFTGTLQLFGAVVIPSYIAAPIAGNNMPLFFIIGGICMALVFVLGIVIPERGKDK
jgi:NNP family nitrate/nitrite transporter-like MFS transporter